jgi:hypothetical protein
VNLQTLGLALSIAWIAVAREGLRLLRALLEGRKRSSQEIHIQGSHVHIHNHGGPGDD